MKLQQNHEVIKMTSINHKLEMKLEELKRVWNSITNSTIKVDKLPVKYPMRNILIKGKLEDFNPDKIDLIEQYVDSIENLDGNIKSQQLKKLRRHVRSLEESIENYKRKYNISYSEDEKRKYNLS